MMKSAVVALALLESTEAFQAPALKASTKAVSATMFKEGDIGVQPPLGVYDPLGLIGTKDMRRYEIMEIKHGRAAMLGFLHTILIEAGARFPGYISPSNGLKFADIPTGNFAALEALPTAGWLQIMTVTCMMETGEPTSQPPSHSTACKPFSHPCICASSVPTASSARARRARVHGCAVAAWPCAR